MNSNFEETEQKIFYESGNLKAIFPFINGKVNGQGKLFYESGALKISGFYKDGKLQGESINYYESGNIKSKEFYNTDGLKDGVYEEYYPNGKLKISAVFKSGEFIEGKKYNESGVVLGESYKNDFSNESLTTIIDGKEYNQKINSNNSSIVDEELEVICVSGDPTGTAVFETYYPTGQVRARMSVKNGLFDGLYEEFYADGKIQERINYKDNNIIGEIESYDENGELIKED